MCLMVPPRFLVLAPHVLDQILVLQPSTNPSTPAYTPAVQSSCPTPTSPTPTHVRKVAVNVVANYTNGFHSINFHATTNHPREIACHQTHELRHQAWSRLRNYRFPAEHSIVALQDCATQSQRLPRWTTLCSWEL